MNHTLFFGQFFRRARSLPLWVGLILALPGCGGKTETGAAAGTDLGESAAAAAVGSFETAERLTEDEAEAVAATFRYLMSVEEPGETVFLASTPISPASGTPVPPPPAVFEALEDLPLILKPATAATITHDPVPDPVRPNRQVLDPGTGLASTIYWANIARRHDDNRLTIETGGFRGYTKSWGFLAELEKRGGRWYVKEQHGKWRL